MSNPFIIFTPGYGKIADVSQPVSWKTTDKGFVISGLNPGGTTIGPIELLFVDEVQLPKNIIMDIDPTGRTSVPSYIPIGRRSSGELQIMEDYYGNQRPLGDAHTVPPNDKRYIVTVYLINDVSSPLLYQRETFQGNTSNRPMAQGKLVVIDNYGKDYIVPYSILGQYTSTPTTPLFRYLLYNSSQDTVPLSNGMIDFIKSGVGLYGAYGAHVILGKSAAQPAPYTAIQTFMNQQIPTPTVSSSSSSSSSSNTSTTNHTSGNNGGKTDQQEEDYKDRVAQTIRQQMATTSGNDGSVVTSGNDGSSVIPQQEDEPQNPAGGGRRRRRTHRRRRSAKRSAK